MSRPARVAIALGGNLGDRHELLRSARAAIGALPGTRLLAATRVEETPPLGGLDQPAYLNQMVLVETALPPHDLLRALQAIEQAHGRERVRTAMRRARARAPPPRGEAGVPSEARRGTRS